MLEHFVVNLILKYWFVDWLSVSQPINTGICFVTGMFTVFYAVWAHKERIGGDLTKRTFEGYMENFYICAATTILGSVFLIIFLTWQFVLIVVDNISAYHKKET